MSSSSAFPPSLRAAARSGRALLAAGALALAGLAGMAPAHAAAETAATAHPTAASSHHRATAEAGARHVLAYYQTQYSDNTYVSPLPLKGIATDVEVAAFHLNSDGTIHLNDDPPSAAKFDRMWSDVAALQASGVKVEALLGGAAQGSYANLHQDFTRYYTLLHDTVQTYHLDGVDLDIEETFSLADTEKLIDQLHTDFGAGFIVTLTPVATDLSGSSSFSGGFSYRQLESDMGSKVSWYTAQFYCGWGDLSGTGDYDAVVAAGFAPSRVVAGTVTNSANCSGYVDPGTLAGTLSRLTASYPDFAGAAGWEYFNAVPVNGTGPASWYAAVAAAMGGGGGGGGGGALTNGGFESGDLSGWTTAGSTAAATSAAHSGAYGAVIGSTSPTGTSTARQTFTVTSGSRLSLAYAITCPDTLTYDWATITLADTTAGSTATLLPRTCTDGAGWQTTSGAVTAGHTYTLTVTNKDDDYPGDATYTYLDDVTVS